MGDLGRTAIGLASARSAVWPMLRRTRYRLLAAIKQHPLDADILDPVVDALAAAEAALIGRDHELKRRRGRGPRPVPAAPTAERALRDRIRDLEDAARDRERALALAIHELRTPLSPVFLIVHRLLEELPGRDDDAVPVRSLRPRLESVAHRLDELTARLDRLLAPPPPP